MPVESILTEWKKSAWRNQKRKWGDKLTKKSDPLSPHREEIGGYICPLRGKSRFLPGWECFHTLNHVMSLKTMKKKQNNKSWCVEKVKTINEGISSAGMVFHFSSRDLKIQHTENLLQASGGKDTFPPLICHLFYAVCTDKEHTHQCSHWKPSPVSKHKDTLSSLSYAL